MRDEIHSSDLSAFIPQPSSLSPSSRPTLSIEHGEFDQTPTVACIDCGHRFPVLDEMTGASGRCSHCECLTFHNEPIGETQGSESTRTGKGVASATAHQGWDGKDPDDGSSDGSALNGAGLSCALLPRAAPGAELPISGAAPYAIAGSARGVPAVFTIFGGDVPPGARLIPFADSQDSCRAPSSNSQGDA